ncbi:MAG: hypothetical protein BM556_06190 [Bacteriovorax sp. MedPE-SWde]|nr:MAG: hypothetical protein BM556_06190 [Bacteriovorax sp. MedPE-SWde]
MENFINMIIKNLEGNGFPDKKVSLPTEKMYEVADSKGFSFNAVLDEMKANHQIETEIGPEKTVFFKSLPEQASNPFEGMDQMSMMKQAQEMMSKMDPEELKKMQDMIMNMSPEEKEELMKKGKGMGLI